MEQLKIRFFPYRTSQTNPILHYSLIDGGKKEEPKMYFFFIKKTFFQEQMICWEMKKPKVFKNSLKNQLE